MINGLRQLEERVNKARKTVDAIRERKIRFASEADTLSAFDAIRICLRRAIAHLSKYTRNVFAIWPRNTERGSLSGRPGFDRRDSGRVALLQQTPQAAQVRSDAVSQSSQ